MSMNRREFLMRHAALSLPLALPGVANAAAWRPPVKLMVPTPAGGPNDLAARLVAQHLQNVWGSSVIVDNRGGGGGTIGAGEFVRQNPDGHTMFVGNPGSNAVAYSIYRSISYKPEQFMPVCSVAKVSGLLSVHPSLPVSTLAELVAYVKARPGKLNYASAGVGQSPHLAAARFVQLTGLDITHVPYKGGAAALTAAIAGQVPILFNVVMPDMPFVRQGKLKAIAVMTAERSTIAPEVPTMRESMPDLLGDFDIASWYGIFLPRGASPEVAAAVSEEVKRFLALPETQKRMAGVGAQPDYRDPAQFGAFVQAEQVKFANIIRREGLQLDPS